MSEFAEKNTITEQQQQQHQQQWQLQQWLQLQQNNDFFKDPGNFIHSHAKQM